MDLVNETQPFNNQPTNMMEDGKEYNFEPLFIGQPTAELNMEAFQQVDVPRDINWVEQRLYEATAELKMMTENQFVSYEELLAHSEQIKQLDREVQEFKDTINMDTHKNWIHLYRHVNETQRMIKQSYDDFHGMVMACVDRKKKIVELKKEVAKLSAMVELYDDSVNKDIANRFDFYEIALELRDPKLDELSDEQRVVMEAKLLGDAGCFNGPLSPHDQALVIYVTSLGIEEPKNPIYLD